MNQSRRMSFVEAVANTVVGYVVALATQFVVFPWFGLQVGIRENLGIGLVFTVVSIVRSYGMRRLFERFRYAKRAQADTGPFETSQGESWEEDYPYRTSTDDRRSTRAARVSFT